MIKSLLTDYQKERKKIDFIVEKTKTSNRFSQFKSILKLNGEKVSVGYGKNKKNAEKISEENHEDIL